MLRARAENTETASFTPGWKMLRVIASIFGSCFLLTQAQSAVLNNNIPISMDPPDAIEEQSINLTLGDGLGPFFVCRWYRGKAHHRNMIVTIYLPPLNGMTFGPAFSKREVPDENCSLQITSLRQSDSGSYIVAKEGASMYTEGEINIEVLAPGLLPKPDVSLIQFFRELDDSVRLNCNATAKSANISWFQDGKHLSSSSRIRLSDDNRTLTIQPLLRGDAGRYQCQVSDLFTIRNSNVTEISVIYGPSSPMIKATGKPSSWPSNFVLTCKADSFPDAEYLWFYNGKKHSEGADLLLTDVPHVPLGSYTCQTRNPLSGQQENATLEIE